MPQIMTIVRMLAQVPLFLHMRYARPARPGAATRALLVREFDSVGVFLLAFVVFGKDLLEPLCLLFRSPLFH
jgi:hypothetical protein